VHPSCGRAGRAYTHLDFSIVGQVQVGVVALRLCHVFDSVEKVDGGDKVLGHKAPGDAGVVL
jgi:hypothetical protein